MGQEAETVKQFCQWHVLMAGANGICQWHVLMAFIYFFITYKELFTALEKENDMQKDIEEFCEECHFFVDSGNFTCCHWAPPQFQLTASFQEEDNGRRSWFTFPFVKPREVACGCFEPRRRK